MADIDPEAEAKAKIFAEAEAEAEAAAEAEVALKAKFKAEARAEVQAELKAEAEAEARVEAEAMAKQKAEAEALLNAKAEAEALADFEKEQEPKTIDIITTGVGTIDGKGLVPIGSKHTIETGAFSKEWMIPDVKTADGIMEIDPQHRFKVNLSSMSYQELAIMLVHLKIKTEKKKMPRKDVERLITSRLVKAAEAEAEK
jgi:hypothetical protein